MKKELDMILAKANPAERSALAKILRPGTVKHDHGHIFEAFWWNCQSIFGYLLGSEPSYSQIVCQVAEKLEIEYYGMRVEDIEIEIGRKVLQTVWEKMTPDQRMAMEAELRRAAQEFDKSGALAGSASVFTALTMAKLSGFGVYLLASTALGTLTGVIGVTLPFAVYTTMSSAIAVIIGPVGWIGAGLFAIWKLTGANYKRLIPAILYVSALRAKQQGRLPEDLRGGHDLTSIGERVRDLVVEQLGVSPDQVYPQASFIDDLGADSLDTVELVMAFEEEFGIDIPDEDVEKMTVVADAIRYLEENSKA